MRTIKGRLPHLALDALFFLWMLHVLVTGRLVPPEFVAFFKADAPIVVISEPAQVEPLADPLPET
jgi:hypothetical protein